MVNLIVWLIVGAGSGWLARIVVGGEARSGTLLNVLVGIAGAFCAGAVLAPLLGISTLHESSFSFPALLVSFTGGMFLVPVVNLLLYSRLSRR
jgi:uncharacterized membrane protein YeaQ/YmgE (transglycosylase-associated protein family)